MRDFEEFTARATPSSSKMMRVAIQRRGNLSLNRAAYQALGEPEQVVLLFERRTQTVGLKPAAKDVRHAYPVRRQANSDSYLIAGQGFCGWYDIPVDQTVAFEPAVEDGVLVFELDKGIPQATRSRKAAGRSRRQGAHVESEEA